MPRETIAYLFLVVFIAIVVAWVHFTSRYLRYLKAVSRGDRHAKPVGKPFWFN